MPFPEKRDSSAVIVMAPKQHENPKFTMNLED